MPRAQVACLMYHEVTDDPASSGFQRAGARPYRLSPRAFASHLEQFALGPRVPELVSDVDPEHDAGHLLLSFDDGGRSAMHVAAELECRGWKAHFFVVTARIGERGFLDAGQIRDLRSAGHIVGSHSHTHPDIFPDLDPARMLEEWRVSCDILAGILGEPCVVASVPGGDISAAVLASAAQAGLHSLFTSEPWLVPRRVGHCCVYGRYSIKAGISPAAVRALGQLQGWKRALLMRRLKVAARRALPPLYRLYVRRTTLPAPSDRSTS